MVEALNPEKSAGSHKRRVSRPTDTESNNNTNKKFVTLLKISDIRSRSSVPLSASKIGMKIGESVPAISTVKRVFGMKTAAKYASIVAETPKRPAREASRR